jgi:hypothetical protein
MTLFWILSGLLFNSIVHDIHVSSTEIYINNSGALEITIKTFYDDLQASLGLIPGEELPADYTSSDELIQKFVNENLYIHANDKPIALKFEEATITNPAVWISVSSPYNFKSGDRLEVFNHILISIYSDQQNILKFETGKDSKMVMLNTKKTSIKYTIDE